MNRTLSRTLLLLILVVYLALGTLYALETPAWQAPDEPAHYNYVRYLAENGRFPVLQAGDYPSDYLEQIKHAKFPPDMPIDGIRYESHQPPLYYALSVPLYQLFRNLPGPWATPAPGLLPLRLFSVLLGAGVVLLTYAIARRIFPTWPALALASAAFVAFLPRHLASVAQAGNDTLAELLLAALLLVLMVLLEAGCCKQPASSSTFLVSGILLGLIAITKTTVYFALALILGVLVWRWWRERASLGRIVKDLAMIALPAALLALPWYIRDLNVYGWPDFLGLRRHDAVVTGQLRLNEFLAQYGLQQYVQQLVVTTFQSFWAVFGWMGVYLDVRLYEALAVLCVVVTGGLILHERQSRQPAALAPGQRYALRLLAATAVLSLLTYAWYNLQFVQFQGRYLFTGLIPVAVAFGLGWDATLRPAHNARLLAAFLALLGVALAVWGLVLAHDLPKWPLALTAVAAAFLAVRPWLPRRLDGLLFALPYGVLPLLALYCLYGGIVPQLAR